MIDVILLLFTLAIFYAGFWLGAKFGTLGAMFERAKATVKTRL